MKWFYTLRNHVKGPFGSEEFEVVLQNLGADMKETFVWTRGKAEWTEAERWTIADAEKIEAQAQSAAMMQTLAPKKSDYKKTDEKTTQPEPSQETAPAVTPPPAIANKAKASSASTNQPQTQQPAQPVKTKTPTQSEKPAQAAQAARPNLDMQATQVKDAKTVKAQMPSQPTQVTQPVDIIVPTDDEITKLLGISATEVIESIKQTADEKFKVQFNGIDQPPMNKEELIKFTAQQEDPSLIMVFDKKLKEWKEIYTFPDIIEKLGLSRRQNRRVTLLANFKGKINDGKEINARLTTISLGGFGLTDVFDLKIGDMVQGQISSPHFYAPLSIHGEVTYSGSHGNIGLKFTKITDEGQALIVDYIKKFGQGVKTESV